MRKKAFFILLLQVITLTISANNNSGTDINVTRAMLTLDSIYEHYGVVNSALLHETYPLDQAYKATYLDGQDNMKAEIRYSYLWPFSGTLSALSALYESTRDIHFLVLLKNRTMLGLEEYSDDRVPSGYASYVRTAPESDRFYDDNVWLGIDFTDLYLQTKDDFFLEKAKMVWTFVLSGKDERLGGGIYWCEQNKAGKNTCSNAPAVVFGIKLYESTNDRAFFDEALSLYEWTQQNLQDSDDKLYYDNIRLDKSVDKTKYAYNSGQMLQASALLYKHTGQKKYLEEAQRIAKSCSERFFRTYRDEDGKDVRLLNRKDIWFSAIMFRGFVELYAIDKNDIYIKDFENSLNISWLKNRDEHGLFGIDWSGEDSENSKWLLTQAAMVEMYARMATCKK